MRRGSRSPPVIADSRVMRPALLGSALATLGLAALTPSQVDHRISQSPVKDQQGRGTCAAFAICGALETFPGIPTDLSEQLLFARVKLHQQDVDRWLRAMARPRWKRGSCVGASILMTIYLTGT